MQSLYSFSPLHHARREWTRVPALGVDVHARIWDVLRAPLISTPVVLVAGLGVSSRYWIPLGRRLAERFHVLAPDLPGFGRTPRPSGAGRSAGPSPREQADQLLAWMNARRIDRAILCGHSVGCQTVADFAARFPERVERVVLAAPTHEPGRRTMLQQLPRLLLGALFERPSLHMLLNVEYGSAGPARILQQAVHSLEDAIERKLPLIEVPTLVLRGSLDPLVSNAWAEQVAQRVPRGSLVTIERVGHALHYSAAAVTAHLLTEFLTGGIDNLPAGGAIAATQDDPRRDPLGPPQPISPALHGVLDYIVAGAVLGLSLTMCRSGCTRRVLAVAAAASIGSNLVSDHSVAITRKLPMITHANLDITTGINLIIGAATLLRREPRSARRAALAFGAYLVAAALLTAKPTGPARLHRIRHRELMRLS